MEQIAQACQAQAPEYLGARIRDGGVEAAVFSHHGECIWFCLFDESGTREIARWRLAGRDGNVHHGFIPAIGAGARYGLRADGPWQPGNGHRFDPAKLLVDPYATRIDRPYQHHHALTLPRENACDTVGLVPLGIVENVSTPVQRAPLNVKEQQSPDFIYEVSVKAFTQRHHDVPPALRGTLEGLAAPAVMEHIAALGVTHVELMPVTACIDERHLPALDLANAWGYNPVTFMALDPRLAPDGMASLRRAVEAFHAIGVKVILDVVFNHTGESDTQGATLSLRGLDNALYFRHAEHDAGLLINDTGCGNTLACDRPPVMRLVLDSLKHFMRHGGVDGFRFDLATILGRGVHGFDARAALLEQIAQDQELSHCLLIAEPWDVGPGGYQCGQFAPRWREWNDTYRDDVRAFWRGDVHATGAFATRLAGSADLFRANKDAPSAGVNFVAAHDGFTLRDLVSHAHKHNQANGENNRDGVDENHSWNCGVEGASDDPGVCEARGRDMRALLATLFVSRGVPMLTAGDEFGRTQNGNNNAYAQDNAITWLDWASADHDLMAFVAALSRLRAVVPVLNEDRFFDGAQRHAGGFADVVWLRADGAPMLDDDWQGHSGGACLAMTLAPAMPDGERVHLAFNRGAEPCILHLPLAQAGRHWRRMLDSARGYCASIPGIGEPALAQETPVPARSVCLWMETRADALDE